MSKKTAKASEKTVVAKRVIKGRQVVESTPVVEATPAAPAAPTKTIKVVKADAKYDGARLAWFQAVVAHDGKSPEDFVATCAATPPVLTKAGKAEDPSGWLRFFVRSGVVAL